MLGLLTTLSAQKEHQTLFSKARVVGGFGGPILEFGLTDGEYSGTYTGGGGGVIVDNFFLGGYGMGGTDLVEQLIDGIEDIELGLGHGGLWLGYTPLSMKVAHPFVSCRLGWGAVDITYNEDQDDFDYTDAVFVVTPEAGIELNVFRWFRIAGTVGYRFVEGISDKSRIGKNSLDGMTAGLTFRFGSFGRWWSNRWDD